MTYVPDLAACQIAGVGFENNEAAKNVNAMTIAVKRVAAETPESGVTAVVSTNVEAAKVVARLKAGEAALTAIVELAKKAMPGAYGSLLDNEFVVAALANAAALALKQLKPGNAKVEALSELLVEAAWIKIADKVKVEDLIEGIVSKVDLSGL